MRKPGQLTAMISSTALDLPRHREQVRDACVSAGVFPIAMEDVPARDATGVQVSREMVDQADIYVGIYAWRYGWVPDFDNPERISITEMEFDWAVARQKAGRLKDILVFVMHDEHPISRRDVEVSEVAEAKLAAFKARAATGRIRVLFESPEELGKEAFQALISVRERHARSEPAPVAAAAGTPVRAAAIPKPPAFYAQPDYIGSHRFVGRQAELQTLNDWAQPADPNNLLLFEAIGGNGKSMLTWEWARNHAERARPDWAGRFWYSFYERGAVMADFCRHALAYITGEPFEEFNKRKTPDLAEELIRHLHARPWLLILDGLERVLVAYHRPDAAELRDEEASTPSDVMAQRDPCSAIRDEDDDLLRALSAARPSKILVSSRLSPRSLLNKAHQPIPGAQRVLLPGLRPGDAEALLRSCGVTGDSPAIQAYVTENCDCHPLVVGLLAGLINDYLPAPGDFDAWRADAVSGGRLNLTHLDVVQRRNSILGVAMGSLSEESRRILLTISLLPDSVDYPTLCELMKPESRESVGTTSAHVKEPDDKLRAGSETDGITVAVRDLIARGLLQYDQQTRRYDLHPVVRSVASAEIASGEKERYGQRVVDYFSSQAVDPFDIAETLEDVRAGINLMRALTRLGRWQEACQTYRSGLGHVLVFNVEAGPEALAVLRPFFPNGWQALPEGIEGGAVPLFMNDVAIALAICEDYAGAIAMVSSGLALGAKRGTPLGAMLANVARYLEATGRIADSYRVVALGLRLAETYDDPDAAFNCRRRLCRLHSVTGQWSDAEHAWSLLAESELPSSRHVYRAGDRELTYAEWMMKADRATVKDFAVVRSLAEPVRNRSAIRLSYEIEGLWHLDAVRWEKAAICLQEAVRLCREHGLLRGVPETALVLAKHHEGRLDEPEREAERVSRLRRPAHRLLAMLWLELGDREKARTHALEAYQEAWADGEPYVFRYELNVATRLLEELGEAVPQLPPYDAARAVRLPWEEAVESMIGPRLR
jgi:tetratricopeptide (TPR) repeat protein